MVRKRKTASLLNRSVQIDPPSAHIIPHVTPPLSSGTLPSGESGCIPERPPFTQATPAPTHPTPQSANPAQSTSPPSSGSVPRPRARFKQPERIPPAWRPRTPSDLCSEGWSTKEEDRISESSGDFNPYLSDLNEYNHPYREENILLNDLAEGFNAIVSGLNDSDDEYGPDLRLRETYINMMKDYNSTFSLGKLQAAVARLLSQLLEERLFMPTPDSCIALRGLMASMPTHNHLNLDLDDVATGEDKFFPLPPDCALIRPPTHRHYIANPPQPPPM